MNELACIDFHGQSISTCKDEQTGRVYCIPREICINLGIAWQPQLEKLKGESFQGYTRYNDIVTPAGGTQETFLLDIDALLGWLLGISPARVNPLVKDSLLSYQRECFQVLRDYWYRGAAMNPRLATQQSQVKNPIHQLMIDAILRIDAAEQNTVQAKAQADAAKAQADAAKDEALAANANAIRALESQLFFTVAEYAHFNVLAHQLPQSAYKACSDYLRMYCIEKNIPFRKMPVGGKAWHDGYAFHSQVYADVIPGWLKRRFAQGTLHALPTPGIDGGVS